MIRRQLHTKAGLATGLSRNIPEHVLVNNNISPMFMCDCMRDGQLRQSNEHPGPKAPLMS